jgi:putative Mg2+ transporter-C (MgtC) family protein
MLTLSLWETLSRLLLALACGAVLGLNRNLHRKSAGVRTFGLVSAGSAVVAIAITQVNSGSTALSPVIQGVLTGIGFLGAGIILHQSNSNHVTGLTTAAAVWLTAALGVACGLGQFVLALSGLAVALLTLIIGRPMERLSKKFFSAARASQPAEDPDDSDG